MLKQILLAAALCTISYTTTTSADTFRAGLNSYTPYQADFRVGLNRTDNIPDTEKDESTESIQGEAVLKYWDGDEIGKRLFLSVPYELTNNSKGTSHGLERITLGFGPRGRIDNFYWYFHGALTFPGIEKGPNRYDFRFGLMATYLSPDKKFEIDIHSFYKFTGEEEKDNETVNPPDELYAGIVVGYRIIDNMIAGGGLTALVKEKDYRINARVVLRWVFSKDVHLELVGDKTLYSKGIPGQESLLFMLRYNFDLDKPSK